MVTFSNPFYPILYLMQTNLAIIEEQLQKRWPISYKWFRKQNDKWDGYTNFIYTIATWEELVTTIANRVEKHQLPKEEMFYYAINRWYNFWSAIAVETIFCSSENIKAAKNTKDRLVDFSLQGIPFDHKTSVYPKGFGKSITYAKAHKEELLYWLYTNQSHQQRQHFANRLFIIVYSEHVEHWKLKAEIQLLKSAITNYVATFNPSNLVTLTFKNKERAVSDIIWVQK